MEMKNMEKKDSKYLRLLLYLPNWLSEGLNVTPECYLYLELDDLRSQIVLYFLVPSDLEIDLANKSNKYHDIKHSSCKIIDLKSKKVLHGSYLLCQPN